MNEDAQVEADLRRQIDSCLETSAALQELVTDQSKAMAKLAAFKAFVHKWLDDAGVPADPDPQRTLSTGCRVSVRLDWLRTERDQAMTGVKISGEMYKAKAAACAAAEAATAIWKVRAEKAEADLAAELEE